MPESRREELDRHLFKEPWSEGLSAIVAGLLYDLVALPYRFVTRRRRRERWRREDAAQAAKREARRARRAEQRAWRR